MSAPNIEEIDGDVLRHALDGADVVAWGYVPHLKNARLNKMIYEIPGVKHSETPQYANVRGKGVVVMSTYHADELHGMERLADIFRVYDSALEFHIYKKPYGDIDFPDAHRPFVAIISLSRKMPSAYTSEEIDAIRDEICCEPGSDTEHVRKMRRKGLDLDMLGFDSKGECVYRHQGEPITAVMKRRIV